MADVVSRLMVWYRMVLKNCFYSFWLKRRAGERGRFFLRLSWIERGDGAMRFVEWELERGGLQLFL